MPCVTFADVYRRRATLRGSSRWSWWGSNETRSSFASPIASTPSGSAITTSTFCSRLCSARHRRTHRSVCSGCSRTMRGIVPRGPRSRRHRAVPRRRSSLPPCPLRRTTGRFSSRLTSTRSTTSRTSSSAPRTSSPTPRAWRSAPIRGAATTRCSSTAVSVSARRTSSTPSATTSSRTSRTPASSTSRPRSSPTSSSGHCRTTAWTSSASAIAIDATCCSWTTSSSWRGVTRPRRTSSTRSTRSTTQTGRSS